MYIRRIPKYIVKYILDGRYRFIINSRYGFHNNMPDETFLKRMFEAKLGYQLNLDNPKTYNEKLQWLKLFDRNPNYTTMVDKYEVKKYVADKLDEAYIIPTIGVWEDVDEISWDSLPNQFVIKCTHDSGGSIVCKDKEKLNFDSAKKILKKCMETDYYIRSREWPYKNVKHRIIAEKYMEDELTHELRDYKVMCFNGEPKLIELHKGRFTGSHTQDFYNTSWERQSISQSGEPLSDKLEPKPEQLDEILDLSRVLASGIPHIRVDWYIVNNQVYFGELTFFDASGFEPFDNIEDDIMLGSWIALPKKNG